VGMSSKFPVHLHCYAVRAYPGGASGAAPEHTTDPLAGEQANQPSP
jgi:hypothetical protein